MSLTDLWTDSPDQLKGKRLNQIIAFAGSGSLRDNSAASEEFREFLSHVPSEMLASFSDECLQHGFQTSGLALQDIVNQVGRRLGFEVQDGRYRGVRGEVGFDGIWRTEDGHQIVIEVKTTDAYRMDLGTLAGYRQALIEAGKVLESGSSILIVVGREDTGDLEAQIRGSRHAWDIRVISVEALLKLMKLKEELEDPLIVQKFGTILTPQEYTRVDGIIDVVFLTAEDVKEETEPDGVEEPAEKKAKFHPVAFNEECAERVQEYLGRNLVRQSRASWRAPDGTLAVLCTVSRPHERSGILTYWYAYHDHQFEFLRKAEEAYAAFGCGSEETVILIPRNDLNSWLEGLNTTNREDGRNYWHVHIQYDGSKYRLLRRPGFESVDLTRYLLPTK